MQSRNTTIGRILFNVDLCNLYRLTIAVILHNLYLVVKIYGFVLCVIIVDLVSLVYPVRDGQMWLIDKHSISSCVYNFSDCAIIIFFSSNGVNLVLLVTMNKKAKGAQHYGAVLNASPFRRGYVLFSYLSSITFLVKLLVSVSNRTK